MNKSMRFVSFGWLLFEGDDGCQFFGVFFGIIVDGDRWALDLFSVLFDLFVIIPHYIIYLSTKMRQQVSIIIPSVLPDSRGERALNTALNLIIQLLMFG